MNLASRRQLRDIVADVYQESAAMRSLARSAGIPPRNLRLQDTPCANAHELLNAANVSGRMHHLLQVMVDENPRNPFIAAIAAGRKMPEGKSIEDTWVQREAIIGGRNDMVPYSWLRTGNIVGAAAVRVDIGNNSFGSGFVVDGQYLVTNNHVIATAAAALHSYIDFFHEPGQGHYRTGLSPDELFATSSQDDLTVVAITDSGARAPDYRLPDEPTPAIAGEFCQIVQHPGGGWKMLGVYDNRITYADERMLQYTTDTLPGSSGSPVFDSHWNLIGVHRSGGWMPVHDGTGGKYMANEATPVARLYAMLDNHLVHQHG